MLNHSDLLNLNICISDLQTVNITLRVLFRPEETQLPKIFTTLGIDYEDRVLPSVTNEVLKAVVVSDSKKLFYDYFKVLLTLFDT